MEFLEKGIPRYFWLRRLHSFTGLGLVIFLTFHLFTNSQTALGDFGASYIRSVNALSETPYLVLIEITLLGLPILIHAILGIKYLLSGRMNTFSYDGKNPYLPEYERNWAYSWQRITSWILLFGLTFHIIHMRFVERPISIQDGIKKQYVVVLNNDTYLSTLSEKLEIKLFGNDTEEPTLKDYLQHTSLKENQVFALTKDFGTAELLIVRDAFKSPLLILIYTIFVLAACFHALNGLWTFMISWGVTVTEKSQKYMLHISTYLMIFVIFLGLASIFGTYWMNFRI